jgi:hypothetical protein
LLTLPSNYAGRDHDAVAGGGGSGVVAAVVAVHATSSSNPSWSWPRPASGGAPTVTGERPTRKIQVRSGEDLRWDQTQVKNSSAIRGGMQKSELS